MKGLAPDLVLSGPEIFKPASVAIGDDDKMFVLDAGTYRLYEYSSEGVLMREVGRSGQGIGEFPFLTEFGSHVMATKGMVAVVFGEAQRAIIWIAEDWSASSFRLNGFTRSAAFDGERLHVNFAAAASPLDDAAVHVYSLDGELVGSYGRRQRPEWEGTLAQPELRVRSATLIAMAPSGRVYEAMAMWPSLRAFEAGELVVDRWYDMSWLDGEAIADIYDRPRSLFESLTVADLAETPELNVYMTLSVSASHEKVVTLLGGGYLQVYSMAGEPGATYKLFKPGDDPDGSQQYGQTGARVAISRDGTRVCVADAREARILCYTLPGSEQATAATGPNGSAVALPGDGVIE